MSKESAAKAFQEFLKSDEGKDLSGVFAIDQGIDGGIVALKNVDADMAVTMSLSISSNVHRAVVDSAKNA